MVAGISPSRVSVSAKARRVFMSGRRFDSAEAVALGLVAELCAPSDLEAAVEAQVAPYLACAPGAVARAKALLRALGPRFDEAVIAQTIDALAECWADGEAHEGIAAFFERRHPGWQE